MDNAAVNELVKLNGKADEIIGIMKTPEKKLNKILELLSHIVGIAGALSIIDIIRNWILGG